MFSKPLPLLFSVFFICELAAQNNNFIVYDIATKEKTILPIDDFDNNITSNKTPAFTGFYNENTIDLPLNQPHENLYNNTTFTNKTTASKLGSIQDYPISTTIKLVTQVNGELFHSCSAVMISSKHVLTAAHCFMPPSTPNEVFVDSIFAVPMYDNGMTQTHIPESQVQKIYFFENWNASDGQDLAVLELERPIGEMTGWLGIGYDKNDAFFENNNFHKLSYPGHQLIPDEVAYNGDTLYYAYGQLGFIPHIPSSTFLGVPQHNGGRPGESGSSIFYTDNEDTYTSYGVLSYVSNYRHSRIQDWQFYALKTIIEQDAQQPVVVEVAKVDVHIFPNPTTDRVQLQFKDFTQNFKIFVLNANGQQVDFIELEKGQLETNIDLTTQPSGVYFLNIFDGKTITSKKIVKI